MPITNLNFAKTFFAARIMNLIEVESPMKRMMEKEKGKHRTLTKCRANKKRRFAAQSTREAEETEGHLKENMKKTRIPKMDCHSRKWSNQSAVSNSVL